MAARKYRAVLFDLLTGLLDSWSLWDRVAGSGETGFAWRRAYLELTYEAGAYRDYNQIIAEAAAAVALPGDCAEELIERWAETEPWPEAADVLAALARKVPLGIVTNSSNALANIGVGLFDIDFDVVVTAETAGFYKPRPKPYEMALRALGCAPEHALFVAGSPADVGGAMGVGMPVFWHNRRGLTAPASGPRPMAEADSLTPLTGMI